MENPFIWSFVFALVFPLVGQGLKKLEPQLADNRWVLRIVMVLVAGLTALAAQLTVVGWPVDWALAVQSTAAAFAGAEVSWQWVYKQLAKKEAT